MSCAAYATYSILRLASFKLGVTNFSVTPQNKPSPAHDWAAA